MNKIVKIAILVSIIICCIVCDQMTKKIAKEKLGNGIPVIYFNDLFRLQYAENDGAFLSLGSELPEGFSFWLLRIIPLIFLIAILVFIIYKIDTYPFMRLVTLTLIFAGGISNIIDRFINNKRVIDFMNMGIGSIFRTGILNFADLYIFFGAVLLIVSLMMEKQKTKDNG
jgi:signal peptidase II